jgi:hypothetical protein
VVSLRCEKRKSADDLPMFEAMSNVPLKLVVTFNNETRRFNLEPGKNIINN